MTNESQSPTDSSATARYSDVVETTYIASGTQSVDRDRLLEFLAAFQKFEEVNGSGFAKVDFRSDDDQILLYWKGVLSEPVKAMIAKAASAGISTALIRVPNSMQELVAASAVSADILKAAGVPISTVGPNDSFTGLLLGGKDWGTNTAIQAEVRNILISQYPNLEFNFIDSGSYVNLDLKVTRTTPST